jgi:hypothetical protein
MQVSQSGNRTNNLTNESAGEGPHLPLCSICHFWYLLGLKGVEFLMYQNHGRVKSSPLKGV